MSDRIAVFNQGVIEQVGTGEALYQNPDTLFVARFLGDSNVIEGQVSVEQGRTYIVDGSCRFLAPRAATSDARMAIVVRPECVRLASEMQPRDAGTNYLTGEITDVTFFGSRRRVTVSVDGRSFLVDESGHGPAPKVGERAVLAWGAEDASLVTIGS